MSCWKHTRRRWTNPQGCRLPRLHLFLLLNVFPNRLCCHLQMERALVETRIALLKIELAAAMHGLVW